MNKDPHFPKNVIKIRCGSEIRRVPVLTDELTYNELSFLVHRLFKNQLSSNMENLIIKYTDEDNELVSLVEDWDVKNASLLPGGLKITVYEKIPEKGKVEDTLKLSSLKEELIELKSKIESFLLRLDEPESGVEDKLKPLTSKDVAEILDEPKGSEKSSPSKSAVKEVLPKVQQSPVAQPIYNTTQSNYPSTGFNHQTSQSFAQPVSVQAPAHLTHPHSQYNNSAIPQAYNQYYHQQSSYPDQFQQQAGYQNTANPNTSTNQSYYSQPLFPPKQDNPVTFANQKLACLNKMKALKSYELEQTALSIFENLHSMDALIAVGCIPFSMLPSKICNKFVEELLRKGKPPIIFEGLLNVCSQFDLSEDYKTKIFSLIERTIPTESDPRIIHTCIKILIAIKISSFQFQNILRLALKNSCTAKISLCKLASYFGYLHFPPQDHPFITKSIRELYCRLELADCWIIQYEVLYSLCEIGKFTSLPELFTEIFPLKLEREFAKFVSKEVDPFPNNLWKLIEDSRADLDKKQIYLELENLIITASRSEQYKWLHEELTNLKLRIK